MDKTLPEMSREIGDLFLVCRQMRYLADAAGDAEAVKAWDKTADALGEAMLATDRVGPCVVCGARTDARCQDCDALLCTAEHATMYHDLQWRRTTPFDAAPYFIRAADGSIHTPCHLGARAKVRPPEHVHPCDETCGGTVEGMQEMINDERGVVSAWDTDDCRCPCHERDRIAADEETHAHE